MREISSDAGAVYDIVEGELIDQGRELEEERKGLRGVKSANRRQSKLRDHSSAARVAKTQWLFANIPGQCRQRRQQQLSPKSDHLGFPRGRALSCLPALTILNFGGISFGGGGVNSEGGKFRY